MANLVNGNWRKVQEKVFYMRVLGRGWEEESLREMPQEGRLDYEELGG